MVHGEDSRYERLKCSKTLADIIATAMSFERTAHEVYTKLRDKVSPAMRDMVHELAAEETRHYKLLEVLRSRLDLQHQLASRIAAPPGDRQFSHFVHLPNLGEHPDEQAILQYAMLREQAAMEQYCALAAEVPDGPIHDLFQYLADEELSHKADLEKRYYDLVYNTDP